MQFTSAFIIILATLALASCGKSSNNKDSDVRISGKLSAAIATAIDSDLNDIRANFVSNNSPQKPQRLTNSLLTLQGYVTATATQGVTAEERFAQTPDQYDYFHVSLQKNQRVKLQVAGLQNTSSMIASLTELEGSSLAAKTGGQKSVSSVSKVGALFIAEKSADYLLALKAVTGASRYILQLQSEQKSSAAQGRNVDFIPGQLLVKAKNSNNFSQALSAQGLRSLSNSQTRQAQISAQSSTTPDYPQLMQLGNFSALTAGTPDPMQQWSEEVYLKIRTMQKIAELNDQQSIEYAQPNFIYHASATANDTYFREQWGLTQINAPLAWDITTGKPKTGDNVVVAVLDTGVAINHPEFNGQLVNGYDFVREADGAGDGNGIDSNPNDPGNPQRRGTAGYHGTHVAGIIAAASNNQLGVSGTSWHAKIMPIRVLGINGSGSSYSLIQGLRFAGGLSNDSGQILTAGQQADVINMSLGSTFDATSAQAERDVINQLYNKGIIMVAAAGNSAVSTPFYPASYDNVISVSATDFSQQLSHFSNFGNTIDIAAPGGSVVKDDNNDGEADVILNLGASDAGGVIQYGLSGKVGTSMAAPHVAGVMALMKAVHPGLTAAQVSNLLKNGVLTTDIGSSGKDSQFGYGRVDALKAVKEAQKLANGGQLPPQPTQLIAEPPSLLVGSKQEMTFNIKNVGGKSPTISISSDKSWLTVEAVGNAATPLSGDTALTYKARINRDGLAIGFYKATLRASADGDNPASVSIEVFMQVGNFSTTGELTQQYVLLVNSQDSKVLQTVAATRAGDFVISDVKPGQYLLVAGSDIDVDNNLCLTAETCAVYPAIGGTPITVTDKSIGGINLTVAINQLGNNSQSNGEKTAFSQQISQQGIRKTALKINPVVSVKGFTQP